MSEPIADRDDVLDRLERDAGVEVAEATDGHVRNDVALHDGLVSLLGALASVRRDLITQPSVQPVAKQDAFVVQHDAAVDRRQQFTQLAARLSLVAPEGDVLVPAFAQRVLAQLNGQFSRAMSALSE